MGNFFVYIIFSKSLNRYYVGHSTNTETRLAQHNSGISKFTASASDWKLVWSEEFPSRNAAQQKERHIKKMKSRKYIETLIQAGK
ncbi:MAG: GIY-YIG nuclease family protein [Chitinophagaceae bacterium]|nr:MAG: GIY-YIG nuclease family protein [Chitinophagaceae bacterium]